MPYFLVFLSLLAFGCAHGPHHQGGCGPEMLAKLSPAGQAVVKKHCGACGQDQEATWGAMKGKKQELKALASMAHHWQPKVNMHSISSYNFD